MRIIATAGHVDHGKSTLVQALTGTDPDRWVAEKERGLTIDLGFATTELPAGPVALVDVPGHERFLGNMVAGVGAVDAVLFVVSAAEGWKAQSEEHLAIVGILGIEHGVVALTHADRVDHDRIGSITDEVRDRLAGTALAEAEIVPTAVPAGLGLGGLEAALDRLVRASPAAIDRRRPRVWVDRTFTIRGAGTVVTGTLTGGSLAVGDTVVTVPGGRSSRIRGIQVHDDPREAAGPGHRVALNLPDLAPDDVGRGIALVEPERWPAVTVVDATLDVRPSAPHPVSHRGALLLHTGTGSWAVRAQVLHDRSIAPGASGLVRIRLPRPLPLRPGDRYLLRDSGSDSTVGGGVVLDLDPVLGPRQAQPDLRWERVVDEHGWIDAALLERLTEVARRATLGRWVVSEAALAAGREEVRRMLDAAGPAGVPQRHIDERLRALVEAGLVPGVEAERDRIVVVEAADALAEHPWLARLAESPFAPPPPDGVPVAEVEVLVRRGLVVRRDGIHFHHRAVTAAAEQLRNLPSARDGGFTVSQARQALGTSRRFVIPLLLELDARDVTRRDGDLRRLVDA